MNLFLNKYYIGVCVYVFARICNMHAYTVYRPIILLHAVYTTVDLRILSYYSPVLLG